MISPEKLIHGFRGTAVPPIMYIRLNEAINNPDSSLADVSQIISDDSSLSARLLKLVNSSFYGFSQRVGTISEAVFLVGSHQVRDLALVTTMVHTFGGIPEDLINMEEFWLHSLACGVGSKVIAQSMGETEIERFFVSGVLHDIGRVILFNRAPDKSRRMLQRSIKEQRPLIDIEREEIGCTHSEIGKALLEAWRLPSYFQEVVSLHHKPEWAQYYPIETASVHVSDVLAHSLQIGSSGERFVPAMNKECWGKLNITNSKIPTLMKKIEHEVDSIAWLLQN